MRDAQYIFIHNYNHFKQIFLPGEPLPPYYYISTWGEIFSAWSGEYLKQVMNAKGYMLVSLQRVDGIRIQRRVHRLVKYTFDYFPGCENLQIDHINTIKTDNRLENLDWVTAQENCIRRGQNGFVPGEVLNYDDTMKICELIIQGLSDDEISQIIPQANRMRIAEIIEGRKGKEYIPSETLQQMRDVRRTINRAKLCTVLPDETKHQICKYFELHQFPRSNNNEKRAAINSALSYFNIENTESNRRIVRRLLIREGNNIIVSQYKY